VSDPMDTIELENRPPNVIPYEEDYQFVIALLDNYIGGAKLRMFPTIPDAITRDLLEMKAVMRIKQALQNIVDHLND